MTRARRSVGAVRRRPDAPAVCALGAFDRGVNSILSRLPELHRVGAQISERLAVRGIGRVFLGEGIVLEAGVFPRRDQIGGVVHHPGFGCLVPQPADVVLPLEAIERDATLVEGLGGGQAR